MFLVYFLSQSILFAQTDDLKNSGRSLWDFGPITPYFTNSISVGRHFLVKNGSSGL
jgi:hypothetical protein